MVMSTAGNPTPSNMGVACTRGQVEVGRGERVAMGQPAPGIEAAVLDEDLELKLCLHVVNRVSSIAAPRDVIECPDLPRDESGEVSRRKLRARSLEKAAAAPSPGFETDKNHQPGV